MTITLPLLLCVELKPEIRSKSIFGDFSGTVNFCYTYCQSKCRSGVGLHFLSASAHTNATRRQTDTERHTKHVLPRHVVYQAIILIKRSIYVC